MNPEDLREMRKDITALIDDIKYHSDSLTDLDRLPVIQLKVILAKINKLTEKSTILLHYIEKEGRLSQKYSDNSIIEESANQLIETEIQEEVEQEEKKEEEKTKEEEKKEIEKGDLNKLLVKDLFSAIGINEKYLFASNLFDGSTSALKEEIQALNDLNTIDEAKSYLNKLAGKYAWDSENETVQNFVSLVERKFDQF